MYFTRAALKPARKLAFMIGWPISENGMSTGARMWTPAKSFPGQGSKPPGPGVPPPPAEKYNCKDMEAGLRHDGLKQPAEGEPCPDSCWKRKLLRGLPTREPGRVPSGSGYQFLWVGNGVVRFFGEPDLWFKDTRRVEEYLLRRAMECSAAEEIGQGLIAGGKLPPWWSRR